MIMIGVLIYIRDKFDLKSKNMLLYIYKYFGIQFYEIFYSSGNFFLLILKHEKYALDLDSIIYPVNFILHAFTFSYL